MKTVLILLITAVLMGQSYRIALADTQIIGWVERVKISDQKYGFLAKIDTGADNSSMHVDDYQLFTKKGTQWIRFRTNDLDENPVVLERKLERIVRVKRTQLSSVKRPVVKMVICVGNVAKSVDINLVNRKNFKYKVLIGRSFLRNSFLIDPAKQLTKAPEC